VKALGKIMEERRFVVQAQQLWKLYQALSLADSLPIWREKPRSSGLPNRKMDSKSKRRSRLHFNGIQCLLTLTAVYAHIIPYPQVEAQNHSL